MAESAEAGLSPCCTGVNLLPSHRESCATHFEKGLLKGFLKTAMLCRAVWGASSSSRSHSRFCNNFESSGSCAEGLAAPPVQAATTSSGATLALIGHPVLGDKRYTLGFSACHENRPDCLSPWDAQAALADPDGLAAQMGVVQLLQGKPCAYWTVPGSGAHRCAHPVGRPHKCVSGLRMTQVLQRLHVFSRMKVYRTPSIWSGGTFSHEDLATCACSCDSALEVQEGTGGRAYAL